MSVDLFNWNDYLELNPDLKNLDITTEESAKDHWEKIGSKQMRLCNKYQLDVINEFGNEVCLYVPYYYYLHQNGLMFDNKIVTYKGMKPYYYFMKPENVIEKDRQRKYVDKHHRPLLVNNDEYVWDFDRRYWLSPPYKSHYKNNVFIYNKPLLIIHNKYNIEWDKRPINFINEETLDKILTMLVDKYQIVYIRPCGKTTDQSVILMITIK